MALVALVRVIRNAKTLSQEEMSGSVEARRLHNIENALSSITIDKLEATSDKLNVDPSALVVHASALERGLTDEQILDSLRIEFAKIDALSARDRISDARSGWQGHPNAPRQLTC